ncbi:PREDICTED: endocuticle structural glycoprotein ABD-5-like [Nicrophorus vespilloides]|uniref:Endocuticle structural glycoprotein ABD-5-like n=1 Tax=Nicrophorus vespilloides TaxID=110193 RepID=A0ABM1MX34_NICVS|nr:PREDICTED: endocuticle structural glycoprotein ABD-5-like [Nicrophorus vespilloides]
MMKLLIIVAVLLFGCQARPYGDEKNAKILQNDMNHYRINDFGQGFYSNSFRTSNGITKKEFGSVDFNVDHPVLVVRGIYSYIGTDGKKYEVTYVADEKGFRISKMAIIKTEPHKNIKRY